MNEDVKGGKQALEAGNRAEARACFERALDSPIAQVKRIARNHLDDLNLQPGYPSEWKRLPHLYHLEKCAANRATFDRIRQRFAD